MYVVYERPQFHKETFKLSDYHSFLIDKEHLLIFEKTSIFSNRLLQDIQSYKALPKKNLTTFLYRDIIGPLILRESRQREDNVVFQGFYLINTKEILKMETGYELHISKRFSAHENALKVLFAYHEVLEKDPKKELINEMYHRLEEILTFVKGKGVIYHLNTDTFYNLNWEKIHDYRH